MKRGKPLKADPAKTREWHDRSRETAIQRARERDTGSSYMPSRTTALKPGKRKPKAKIPKEMRKVIYLRTGGKCVRPSCERRAATVQHWFTQDRWPELAKVEANMSGSCLQCNLADATGHPYFPHEAIPDCTHRLAAKLGPSAQSFLERRYPQGAKGSTDSRLSNKGGRA